jgi:hypothetical protein
MAFTTATNCFTRGGRQQLLRAGLVRPGTGYQASNPQPTLATLSRPTGEKCKNGLLVVQGNGIRFVN